MNIPAASEIASAVLGDDVTFLCDDEGMPVRATVWGRWVTPIEWARLRRVGLELPARMVRAPRRRRREDACPCPGCGFCACKWVGDGRRQCQRALCICPRERPPVRLALMRIARDRTELVLHRGHRTLALLGVWTLAAGWDLALAGDAKARSLAKVMPALLERARIEAAVNGAPLPGVSK
jgi:hypothetical protein